MVLFVEHNRDAEFLVALDYNRSVLSVVGKRKRDEMPFNKSFFPFFVKFVHRQQSCLEHALRRRIRAVYEIDDSFVRNLQIARKFKPHDVARKPYSRRYDVVFDKLVYRAILCGFESVQTALLQPQSVFAFKFANAVNDVLRRTSLQKFGVYALRFACRVECDFSHLRITIRTTEKEILFKILNHISAIFALFGAS